MSRQIYGKVKISQLRTVSTERLSGRIGAIEVEALEHIIDDLNEMI